jgi:hypothetical protein
MPKFTLLSFFLFPSLFLTAQSSSSFDLDRKFDRDTVIKSYSDLFRELAIKHPGFYRYHSRQSMNLYIDSVFQTIQADSVSGWEVYRKMKPIVGKIGCLHTGLTLSKQYERSLDSFPNLLPFQLLFRDNKAWVIKNFSGDLSIQPGTELTHINGKTIAELLQIILPAIPSDGYNMTMKYLALYHDFPRWYRSMVEQSASFQVIAVNNGRPLQHEVRAVAKVEMKLMDGFMSEITFPKQLEFNIKNGVGMLSVHSFAKTDIKKGDQRYKKFIRSSFAELKKRKIENLVLDLRYNTGGTDANAAYLSKYFFDRSYRYWDRIEVTESVAKEIKGIYKLFYKKPVFRDSTWHWKKTWVTKEFNFYRPQRPAKNHFTGNTYVLINGFCMSSCADLAGVLSYNKKAIFAGEETGGGFQGNNSGMMPETLALAGLTMTVPLQKYYTAVDPAVNFGKGTLPDHVVLPSVQDLINNKDVVMEYVLQLIRTSATLQ